MYVCGWGTRALLQVKFKELVGSGGVWGKQGKWPTNERKYWAGIRRNASLYLPVVLESKSQIVSSSLPQIKGNSSF